MRYVMHDVIKKIEHRATRRWLRGTGKDAEFSDASEGWWAVLTLCPMSVSLGNEEPRPSELSVGDAVRLTLERA